MKNCLKTLISVTLLSALLTVGSVSFATFKDYGSIQYKTAVGVMNGIGIINGYLDGSFKPDEYITREEAAKMVSYAVLGEQGIMELKRNETTFSDVVADCWSAPYINWCEQNGIINGYGDGSFNPSGSITGYQLSKMLLCATGYGKNGEYSGASWDLSVSKDAFTKGISSGTLYSNPSKNVTREEAALYIFKAITGVEQVEFDKNSSKYVPADGTETCDNTLAAEVYGIITSGDKANIYNGIITGNNANSDKNTIINGNELDYSTGLDLLGHSVCVYSNGLEGLKSKIYCISDESTTVEVKQAINSKINFEKVFASNYTYPPKVFVLSPKGILVQEASIKSFDPSNYTAPIGTYIFKDNVLISYIPIIEEFSAVVGKEKSGLIKIGEKEYPSKAIYSPAGKYSAGDVVLAKFVGSKINISQAISFNGCISKIDTDDSGLTTYVINGAKITESTIRDESTLPKVKAPELGKLYKYFLDSQGNVFAIVSAQ